MEVEAKKGTDLAVEKANKTFVSKIRKVIRDLPPRIVEPTIQARGVVLALRSDITSKLKMGYEADEIREILVNHGVNITTDTLKRYTRPSRGLKRRERVAMGEAVQPKAERAPPAPMAAGPAPKAPTRAVRQGRGDAAPADVAPARKPSRRKETPASHESA